MMSNASGSSAPQSKRQDRTVFCRHCGISFLWTSEEQATAGAPAQNGHAQNGTNRQSPPDPGNARPTHCPACRRLLPAPSRERGLVKWYNRRKRFGFITRKDQPDIFVHGSALPDRRPLTPDQLVEFAIDENDQGLIAVDVVRLERSAQAGDPDPRRDPAAPNDNPAAG